MKASSVIAIDHPNPSDLHLRWSVWAASGIEIIVIKFWFLKIWGETENKIVSD